MIRVFTLLGSACMIGAIALAVIDAGEFAGPH